jgi:hypothetical protein
MVHSARALPEGHPSLDLALRGGYQNWEGSFYNNVPKKSPEPEHHVVPLAVNFGQSIGLGKGREFGFACQNASGLQFYYMQQFVGGPDSFALAWQAQASGNLAQGWDSGVGLMSTFDVPGGDLTLSVGGSLGCEVAPFESLGVHGPNAIIGDLDPDGYARLRARFLDIGLLFHTWTWGREGFDYQLLWRQAFDPEGQDGYFHQPTGLKQYLIFSVGGRLDQGFQPGFNGRQTE